MVNSRFPSTNQRWVVDARRNRSMACSAAAMALVGVIFTLALLAGCTGQRSASSPAANSAAGTSAPATDSARSDFKFDDSPQDPSQNEYSKYVLG